MRKQYILVAFLFLVSLFSVHAVVEEYKPYLHKAFVPEHPKLLLSGTSQVELFTGAEQFTYPIIVPPGTTGLQPTIELTYESHRAADKPTIVGTGWKLTDNYIGTNTNYTNETNDDYYELVLNGVKHELVYIPSENRFHTKRESFLSIENKTGASNNDTAGRYWLVRTKDGRQYRFGFNNDSAFIHNASVAIVARWSLDLVNDTHGNQIFYSYVENPFSSDANAVYPSKIEYNNDKKRVINFVYENANRPDIWMSFDNGALVNESRRLQEIFITADTALVRRYVFEYTNISTPRTALASITLYGFDNTTNLPPTRFTYTTPEAGWRNDTLWLIPASMNFIDTTNEDVGTRFADINGDGFIDVLRAQATGTHEVWLNNGSGWQNTTMWNLKGIADFVLLNGQDNGTRIEDINHDGLPDLIHAAGTGRSTYLNNGTDWIANSTWNLPAGMAFVDTASGKDLGVRLVDLNGDGWMDILKATTTERTVFLNNGTRTPDAVWWNVTAFWAPPSDAAFVNEVTPEDKGVRIADVNNDGYPDLLKGEDVTIRTWLNRGNGSWLQDPSWDIPVGAAFINGTVEEQGVRIADANGDRLPDLVQGFSGSLQTWLNTGNRTGWQFSATWALPTSSIAFVDAAGKNKGVRIVDVNGDEMPDIVKKTTTETLTYLSNASRGYLLQTVVYEYGGNETFAYSSSTKFNETGNNSLDTMNFNLWLVANVTKNNSMSGSQNQFYRRLYNYSYGGYDPRARQFRGFGFVVEQNNDTVVKHWFHQDDARAGREYVMSVHAANGTVYQNSTADWVITNKDGYNITLLASQKIDSHDGQATARSVNVSYSYDVFGNTVEVNSSGDMAVSGDETYQRLVYVNNSALWIVGVLENHSVYGFTPTTLMKRTLYLYDNNALGGVPTKGEITRKEEWSNSSADMVAYYGYDFYGNVIQVNDSLNRTMNYTFGLRDTTFTFVEQAENSLGQKTKYTYNLSSGNLMNVTDSNGIETNYTYDVFHRISKEIQPFDSDIYPTKEYLYTIDGIAPERIIVFQKEVSGAAKTLDTRYFYDGFGKLVQVKREAENNALQVAGDIYYDSYDMPVRTSNPYYTNFTSDYTAANSSVAGTNYTYDPLDRVIEVRNPDTTRIQIVFRLWNVTTYNENGKRMDYVLDGNGNIVQVLEYLNNGTNTLNYSTNYKYDALNQLLQINDSKGNTFNFTYDSLGRTIQLQDPDLKTWSYSYDALGNLIKQEGSAGELITDGDYYREYNALHQLIRVREGSTSTGKMVEEYFYDHTGNRIKNLQYRTNTTIYTPFREWMRIVNTTGSYDYMYVYDGNTLIARKNPDNTTWYYHDDHLGSTSLITDENGNIVEETFYYPFGGETEGGEKEAYLLYTNQFKDAIGCYDYGARVYCPKWYHFTSGDPVVSNVFDPQGLNRYAYVKNNPYKYVDPDGKNPLLIIGGYYAIFIGGNALYSGGAEVYSQYKEGARSISEFDKGAIGNAFVSGGAEGFVEGTGFLAGVGVGLATNNIEVGAEAGQATSDAISGYFLENPIDLKIFEEKNREVAPDPKQQQKEELALLRMKESVYKTLRTSLDKNENLGNLDKSLEKQITGSNIDNSPTGSSPQITTKPDGTLSGKASNNSKINFNNMKGVTSFKAVGQGGIARRSGGKKGGGKK